MKHRQLLSVPGTQTSGSNRGFLNFFPGATMAAFFDFVNGIYKINGIAVDVNANITTNRSSTAYSVTSSGNFQSFSANTLRITNNGLVGEQSKVGSSKYSATPTSWNAGGGCTYTSVGTNGPFTRTLVTQTVSTALTYSGPSVNSAVSWTAGQPMTCSFYYEMSSTGKVVMRIQQTDSGFQPSTLGGFISEAGVGPISNTAGNITNVKTKQLGPTLWKTTCTFVPLTTQHHTVSISPYSTTIGDTIVILGAQSEPGDNSFTSIIPTTTATVTRAADALTFTGQLASLLSNASGMVVLTVDNISGFPGNILSGGTSDVQQWLYGAAQTDVYSVINGVKLSIMNGGTNFDGSTTLAIAWDGTGRKAVWDNGLLASDTTTITASITHLLGGINGRVQTLQIYNVPQSVTSKTKTSGWKTAKIGGGGWLVGMSIAADGTKVCKADTYGAYLWVNNAWKQLVTSTSMPVGDLMPMTGAGVWEIVIAPSLTTTLYMMYNGYVYKSINSGTTWVRTAFTQVADANANGTYRLMGKKMAVDPVNANIVCVSSPSGVWKTTDGGATWTNIATVGSTLTTTSGFAVVFDASSSVQATTIWPDASTTGVPAGTVLTPSGALSVSTPGTVISGLDVSGVIYVSANNVTIQNCRVISAATSIIATAVGVTGLTVNHCELNGLGLTNSGTSGITAGCGTFTNNNIYNVENGVAIDNNVLVTSPTMIAGNYIHDLNAGGSPHYDGIQIDGNSSNVTITGNTIVNQNNESSAVMIDNYFGPISNITVSNNLLYGGGYPLYVDGHFNTNAISGVTVTNNHIGGGIYGQDTAFNNTGNANYVAPVYTGNISDAATQIALLNTVGNVTPGYTPTAYIAKDGVGVYKTTNSGSAWALINGPTSLNHMVAGQDGYIYVTPNDGTSNVYIYNGSWSMVSAGTTGASGGVKSIAIDPSNTTRIVAGSRWGNLSTSLDHGATWSGWSSYLSRVAKDVPWLTWTNEYSLGLGDIVFDPSATNTLYVSEGTGVWHCNPPNNTVSSGIEWTSQTAGIEQLVSNKMLSLPYGPMMFTGWDRPVFRIVNPDTYPYRHGPTYINNIIPGWDIDYAGSNNQVLVVLANGLVSSSVVDASGISTDGGLTWTAFPTKPAHVTDGSKCYGGCIAAASATNILWFPTFNSPGYYTLDGGTTWTECTMAGVNNTPVNTPASPTGWGTSTFKRHIIVADKNAVGTFYAYNTPVGLFKSTNGGVSWSLIFSGEISNGSQYNTKLKMAPDSSSMLFATGTTSTAQLTVSSGWTSYMKMSVNNGVTWNTISNVREVWDFSYGKAAPGSSYYTIYIVGYVYNSTSGNYVYGAYRSEDNCTTWISIGQWPNNSLDIPVAIEGDINIYGRCYVALGGSSVVYYDV